MKQHNLKCWPLYFWAIKKGQKTFEIRINDREFLVGDILVLQEFNSSINQYTGEICIVEVTFVLEGGQFGVSEEYCVLAIKHVDLFSK